MIKKTMSGLLVECGFNEENPWKSTEGNVITWVGTHYGQTRTHNDYLLDDNCIMMYSMGYKYLCVIYKTKRKIKAVEFRVSHLWPHFRPRANTMQLCDAVNRMNHPLMSKSEVSKDTEVIGPLKEQIKIEKMKKNLKKMTE